MNNHFILISRSVKQPLQWRSASTKPRVYIFVVTFFAVVLAILPICLSSHIGWSDATKLAYFQMLTFVGFGLPMASTVVIYALAIDTLRKQRIIASSATKNRIRIHRKTIRLFTAVLLCFFVSVFPHLVVDVYFQYKKGEANTILVHESAIVFHTLNACVNPFIYAKMHHDIQSFLTRLWNCIKTSRDGAFAAIASCKSNENSTGQETSHQPTTEKLQSVE